MPRQRRGIRGDGHRPLRTAYRNPMRHIRAGRPVRPYTPTAPALCPHPVIPSQCSHWRGNPSPFHVNQRPKAATCRFAAKARFDNRPLQVWVFPKREGCGPPSLVAQDGGFSRGKEDRNFLPLEWRFWLLLSLLTKSNPPEAKKKKKYSGRSRPVRPPHPSTERPPCFFSVIPRGAKRRGNPHPRVRRRGLPKTPGPPATPEVLSQFSYNISRATGW